MSAEEGRPVPTAHRLVRAAWRILLFQVLLIPLDFGVERWTASVAAGANGAAMQRSAFATLVAALGVGLLLATQVDRRPAGTLGLRLERRALLEIGAGIFIGAASIGAVVLLLSATGCYRYTPEPGTGAVWLSEGVRTLGMLTMPASAEEALYRGYPFQALVQGIGAWPATLLGSGLFSYAHAANPGVGKLAMANIFLAGVLLSVAFLRTGSLWFASALHLGWNWMMAGPLDLPVSGLELVDMPLYDPAWPGPAWITGADFGPEAGVAGTAGVLLALLMVYRMPRREYAVEERTG